MEIVLVSVDKVLYFEVAMDWTNDAIFCGEPVYCIVGFNDEASLKKSLSKHPDFGKPFLQIFRKADRGFYKIVHNLFAPAVLMVNNAKTGGIFEAGEIDPELLKEDLGF